MIRTFIVEIKIKVNIDCLEDENIDISRAKASQEIDSFRQSFPYDCWIEHMPLTDEEIITGRMGG